MCVYFDHDTSLLILGMSRMSGRVLAGAVMLEVETLIKQEGSGLLLWKGGQLGHMTQLGAGGEGCHSGCGPTTFSTLQEWSLEGKQGRNQPSDCIEDSNSTLLTPTDCSGPTSLTLEALARSRSKPHPSCLKTSHRKRLHDSPL